MRASFILPWLVVVCGCAHDVAVKMPESDAELSGSIEILFTREADDVTVVVDRTLVVRGVSTERIVVRGVEAGVVEVMIAAGSGQGRVERFMRAEVDVGKTTTIPVAAPDRSMMADLPSTVVMLVLGLAVRATYLALF